MDANIREVDGKGWLATISHYGYVVYAIGNTREGCVERFKRAIVVYNDDYARRVYGAKSHLPPGIYVQPSAWETKGDES